MHPFLGLPGAFYKRKEKKKPQQEKRKRNSRPEKVEKTTCNTKLIKT